MCHVDATTCHSIVRKADIFATKIALMVEISTAERAPAEPHYYTVSHGIEQKWH